MAITAIIYNSNTTAVPGQLSIAIRATIEHVLDQEIVFRSTVGITPSTSSIKAAITGLAWEAIKAVTPSRWNEVLSFEIDFSEIDGHRASQEETDAALAELENGRWADNFAQTIQEIRILLE